MEIPDPQYAKTEDGAYIAYQVVGDGPIDIAWQLDFYGGVETIWEVPWESVWLGGLASFARVILHDRRATGLSSRNVVLPNLETRAADLRAVLDAAGSQSAVLGGWLESVCPCLMLAASDPERTRALIWWNPRPRTVRTSDYPWGWTPDEVEADRKSHELWGTIEYGRLWADQFEADTGVRPSEPDARALAKRSRHTCTPDVALELSQMWWDTDVRGVLPSVRVPTLLLASDDDSSEIADYVASLMPQAEVQVLPSDGWPSGRDELARIAQPRLEAIQRFIGLEPKRSALDLVLSTVLFTDVVGSTERQARIGDRAWRDLIERHHALVREALGTWRGVENNTTGDGFYATFDGPARAIHCALDIHERVRELGLEVRAGVHTGECELVDGQHGGLAVTIGSRVCALAEPSQVLVSQTVKDLVAGSGFTFEDAGEHELKGVPGRWRVFAAS